MTENFPSDRAHSAPPDATSPDSNPREREPVRLIVVSSRRGITTMIQTLHLRGVVSADDWSPLQVEPMTGKWMSVVTKYIQFD